MQSTKRQQKRWRLSRTNKWVIEERLLEILHQEKTNNVIVISKSLGMKDYHKLQKHNIIRKIRDTIIKDYKFHKTFKNFGGSPSGYLTWTCPHKVVHSVKCILRVKEPRDYIDMLLSKHNTKYFNLRYAPNDSSFQICYK